MGLFEHFPYTNFHNVNLDWLLTKMEQLIAQMEALTDQVTALAQQVSTLTTQLQTLTSTVTQISTRLTTAEGKIQTLESDVATISQDLEEVQSDVAEISEPVDITSDFRGSLTLQNVTTLAANSEVFKIGKRIYGRVSFTSVNQSNTGHIVPATRYLPMAGVIANVISIMEDPIGYKGRSVYSGSVNGFIIDTTDMPHPGTEIFELSFDYQLAN